MKEGLDLIFVAPSEDESSYGYPPSLMEILYESDMLMIGYHYPNGCQSHRFSVFGSIYPLFYSLL